MLLAGVVHEHDGDALRDIEHGISAVAHDHRAVEIEHKIGRDVLHVRRDDEGLLSVVGDLNIGITVFNGVVEFLGRSDDIPLRSDKLNGIVIGAVIAERTARISAVCGGIEKGRRHQ